MKIMILGFWLINLFIKIFRLPHLMLVLKYRDRSREVVYNYWLRNGGCFLLPQGIILRHCQKTRKHFKSEINGGMYLYNGNKYLRNEKISKLKYYWYLWTVWVWLDDTNPNGIFNLKDLLECNKNNKSFMSKYGTTIKKISDDGSKDRFQIGVHDKYDHIDLPISFIINSILASKSSNFKLYFSRSRKKITIFNMGYKERDFSNNSKEVTFKLRYS